MNPPKIKKIQKKLEIHNDTRIDNYYWLNDRENQEVIEYLKQENKYTKNQLEDTKYFQKSLFKEMKSRIKEKDESTPYLYNGYFYSTKYKKGKEYPLLYRKKNIKNSKKELLLDENKLAKKKDYFDLGSTSVTLNNEILAFASDSVGRRIYTIEFKNLKKDKILDYKIENTTGEFVWANDNKTLFYIKQDEKTLRAYQLYKHILGTNPKKDVLIYQEKDETFNLGIYKTKSNKFLMLVSSSTLSDEYQFIKADKPNSNWKIFQEREQNLEYSIEHFNDEFFIRTNLDNATNFKIMKTHETLTEKENWIDFIAHQENILIESIEIFKKYFVIEQRINGLIKFNVQSWNGKINYFIPFDEEVYTAYSSINVELKTKKIRIQYSSMTTPWSTLEFNLKTQKKKVLKEQKVKDKNFNKENYITKRIWVNSRDNKKIPISLVYNKKFEPNPESPLVLYGYGSYGISIDATFSSTRLSLLNRGFIFAIAHIRGGEDLGRKWYDEGKMLNKKNTFYDFIDSAKFLIQEKMTSSEHLYAIGGSAGGLLLGTVVNIEPKLFNGMILQVPFLDVVTTMLDDSIPLTTGEYDEWGNPNEKKYYDYIKSYSPYDNIEPKEYPNILVTSGLHDSQVQYWEPTKWVAKLRELKTDDNLLLLKTNMKAGHGGASGRFESLKENALEYAFLLKLENIKN